MKIIVTTENKAKIQAVQEVLVSVWKEAEIIGEKFSSDILDQPMSEEEGVEGAINRAKNARDKYPEADYCIGMEGYVDTNKQGMFLAGVVAIMNLSGDTGVGFSAKMQLPDSIKEKIEEGVELGPLVQNTMSDSNNAIRNFDGTNGILSKNLYNRVDEFKDATKCALVKFISPELYEVGSYVRMARLKENTNFLFSRKYFC